MSSTTAPVVTRSAATARPAARRVTVGRALTAFASLTALVAAATGVSDVVHATPDTRVVQTWWLYGLVAFAGLFALLAARPLRTRWLWELVLVNKLALSVTALAYALAGSATGTGTIIAADGGLFVVLLAGYVLVRGWRAGR